MSDIDYMGKRVLIVSSDKRAYSEILHKEGIVVRCGSSTIGIEIDGVYNKSSTIGLFWFKRREVELIDNNIENGGFNMNDNFKIAVVQIKDDYNKKDYGFALYDDANVGDLVLTNANNSHTLGVIKAILTQEEYKGNVTKEVLTVIDISTYTSRVEERERIKNLEKEKVSLQKELDNRISKLKDLEYYERMAKELETKDPSLTELANRLKELSK